VLVDRARDDLFAGTGFTKEQDRRAAPGHHARARHDRRQPRVGADHPFLARRGAASDQVFRDRSKILCHVLELNYY
jgi:hypothetical protein